MEMPDKIEVDCKYTTKGYLQVEQWSAKEGIRTPPINGNSRHDYYHSRIVEALKAENVTLMAIIDQLQNRIGHWQVAHSEMVTEVDLRVRIAELEAAIEAERKRLFPWCMGEIVFLKKRIAELEAILEARGV